MYIKKSTENVSKLVFSLRFVLSGWSFSFEVCTLKATSESLFSIFRNYN